jgi:D-apionolactonase
MNGALAQALYGTPDLPLPQRRLVAGPLSALLDGGGLRAIRSGDTEVIRGISFVVRSRSWGTLTPDLRDLSIHETAQSFMVSYTALVQEGAQSLSYAARINAHADGRLEFGCEATANTSFQTCRVGFVVLHPIAGVAGGRVRIEQVDGRNIEGRFPQLIDPVQPMLNLRQLAHKPLSGLTVTCRLEGDTFEMEDHRNWTDASFKTYSRPLALPWPFTLSAGEHLAQTVTLTLDGPTRFVAGADPGIRVTTGPALGPMPPIGLGCTPDEAEAALPHIRTLREAGVAVLVCRFDPRQSHGNAELARYRDLSEGIGTAIELQVVVPSLDDFAADLAAAASAVASAGLALASLMVVPAADLVSTPPGSSWPPCPPLDAVYRAARSAFPGVRLGGGMFTHFTELNRKRPPLELLDFVTFASSAIVHAADDRSVMETIEALPHIAASVRAIAGSVPFVVGPSGIGLRDNPNGQGPLPNPQATRLPMAARDPRQRGLFNAAWTLGYVSAFAHGGAARIAASAPAGDFGILDGAGVWPVYHVLRACAALRGGEIRALHGIEGTPLAGLLIRQDEVSHLLLANLGPDELIAVPPEDFVGGSMATLDAASLQRGTFASEAAASARLTLDPYAVARLRTG